MNDKNINIIKYSGEKVTFSSDKLYASLKKTGAEDAIINEIIDKIQAELYQNISTKEIYNRAFALLKRKKNYLASKYKLKKAIYELGPTGFPFERFVASVLKFSGYSVEVGKILNGKCVTHEIDVIATKNNETTIIECKFHGEQGLNCNVKIPLYINSRYLDVKANWTKSNKIDNQLTKGWLVTNTRFTEDALRFGTCCGLYLVSWDYPKGDGLKDRIGRLGLYPITVSTLLTNREKAFLLNREVVLCRELIENVFFLDHLGVSNIRKERILKELNQLCNSKNH
jgi:hypothetical protein